MQYQTCVFLLHNFSNYSGSMAYDMFFPPIVLKYIEDPFHLYFHIWSVGMRW